MAFAAYFVVGLRCEQSFHHKNNHRVIIDLFCKSPFDYETIISTIEVWIQSKIFATVLLVVENTRDSANWVTWIIRFPN